MILEQIDEGRAYLLTSLPYSTSLLASEAIVKSNRQTLLYLRNFEFHLLTVFPPRDQLYDQFL